MRLREGEWGGGRQYIYTITGNSFGNYDSTIIDLPSSQRYSNTLQ